MAYQQNIKINLLFDAQTAAAQTNIQQLSSLLHSISTTTTVGVDSGSLTQAVNAAQQLQIYLQKAVDVNTGKLDLTKLNSDLRASGQTLQNYAAQLTAVGPKGEQAFLRLASAISSAKVPMVQTNKVLKDFMQTLANTAKWQIASTAIHGIQGMLNSAVSHAKDLNKALTDIQIVTGYSTNYMSNFADSAAKAAKELNTTTTEYAKAALIFYQQGLSGKAVEDRAKIVVKLSQVTGDSAQKVSDQMTALWNNFYDGSQSLEYFADVIAKLGAATAASTSEISDGLEKFAAIAETVGLSYEYAAAALATVIDKTRQSPEVIGTAFKTIFARMQGLSLGETLEDGVDLNKYSEALDKVGVQVLKADGSLRDMDQILDDLGEKWDGLGDSSKVALAQTVGGVRQYNQVMSMMNNWEDVHKNIDLATESTGELIKQHNIWSASYESSLNKLQQAKNELYEKFIDDDFLIGWNDSLTIAINGLSEFIDAFGGLGGTIKTLGLMFSGTLLPLLMTGFTKLGNAISVWTGKAARDVAAMQNAISQEMSNMINKGNLTNGMRQQIELSQLLLSEKQKLMLASKRMSEVERAEAESRLAIVESLIAETNQILAKKDALEKAIQVQKKELVSNPASRDQVGWSVVANRHQGYDEDLLEGARTISRSDLAAQKKQAEADLLRHQNNNAAVEADLANVRMQKKAMFTGDDGSALRGKDRSAVYRSEEYQKLIAQEKQLELEKANASEEADREKIERLTKMIQLQKDYNQYIQDPAARETGIVGQTKGVVAGEIDQNGFNSARLHQEDREEKAIRYDAENAQMKKAQSTLGDSAQFSDGGALVVDASIANYEKLYEAIGNQMVLQEKLKAITKDVENATSAYTKAQQEAATASNNLKKAGAGISEQRKKELANIKVTSKEYKNLSQAEQEYVKALKDLDRANSNVQKSSSKATSALKASKDQYIALAKEAGLSGEKLDKLKQDFDELGTTNGDDAMKSIMTTFTELGIAADNVKMDLDLLAQEMQELLINAGMPREMVQALTDRLRQLANTAPQVQNGINGVNGALGGLQSRVPSVAASVGTMATSLMTVFGSAQMLTSAFSQLQNAFGEGGTAAEKFSAILTTVMAILPIISTLTHGLTNAKKKETAASLKNAGANVVEAGTKGLLTKATWAQTTANLANLLSNPWTMAIAAIAIAAIGAMIGYIGNLTKETEASTEANYELTEAQRESAQASVDAAKKYQTLSEAWREQMNEMDKLIAKYKELRDAQKDTSSVAEQISDITPDNIEAYEKLIDSMNLDEDSLAHINEKLQAYKDALAMGDIDEIDIAQWELDKLITWNDYFQQGTGSESAMKIGISDIAQAEGIKAVSGTFDTDPNDGLLTSGVFIDDLNADSVIKELSDEMGTTRTWYGSSKDGVEEGYLGFGLDGNNVDGFIEDYEALLALKREAEATISGDALADDKGYLALKTILETGEAAYNDAITFRDNEITAGIAKESMTWRPDYDISHYENGEAVYEDTGPMSYNDYKAHRDQVMWNELNWYYGGIDGWDPDNKAYRPSQTKNGGQWDAEVAHIDELASQYWLSNSDTEIYEKVFQRIERLKKEDQWGSSLSLADYLSTLSPEDLKLFLEVDINKYQSTAAIQGAIEAMQLEADGQEIQVKITAIGDALGALKESGMTLADWKKIQESLSWGQDGIMDFSEFMDMDYVDQKAYLEDTRESQHYAANDNAQAKIASLEASLEAVRGEIEDNEWADEMEASKGYIVGRAASTEQLREEEAQLLEELEAAKIESQMTQAILDDLEFEKTGLDEQEVKDYTQALLDMAATADPLDGVADALADNEEAAKDIAIGVKTMNRGLGNLGDKFTDIKEVLDNGAVASSEYQEALSELDSIMSDVLTIDTGTLSKEFLSSKTNLELMEEAAKGSVEAIEKLRLLAAQDIVIHAAIDEAAKTTLLADLANLASQDIEIGATLNNTQFADSLYDAAIAAGMTVDDIQRMFDSLGWEPDIKMETYTLSDTDVTNGYVDVPADLEGNTQRIPLESSMTTGATITYPVIQNGTGSKTGGFTYRGSAASTADTSKLSDGGGGGGKPKKADKVKKSDVVERYKEINDQLEETAHLMNKTSAAAEGLWGKARFDKMREGVELLKQENQQLKERMKWSKDYVDEDRISLNAAAAEAGVSFQYDDNGYITNYTEQMTWLYNQLDNAINSANADGNATEEEQEEIDKWQKYIDDIESARGDYEDALAQWREDEEKWLENRNKIWQDNFDILSEELELEVQLNTQDLEVLQYFLDKIEDTVYGIAEAFASGQYFQQQFANYSANLGLLSNETGDPKTQGFYQNLQDQYRNGDIGLPQYKQGLADMMGMTIENLESLQDLKESMQDFYGDVMEKALEEIAIYTDSMENLNSVLDHYSNILELVGKQDDYASKNKVLSSKAKNLRNEIDVQKRLYEESAADAEYWAQKMNEAEVDSNEYETYKKNWQAAEAAAQESQDAMLSKTQEWAEAMKSIIENELADFADQLEKSLTGGVSFDELMTSMERRSSLQEEYLTTTNKIYETNKLMRTAQQEIDKTSNTAAKRRMAQFISETQQLQNKNKLSQYELEIQQAKYDLLLAEIALEEAQDAKSIVRLQRDAEGNFGYVYTADQNAVADAEQQLADAQNNLYNIGLEGANNYQQKYAETLQESQEAITELTQMWMNGEISSEEEFNRRKQEIVEYYGEKLQQYSDLHSIALTTDSRVVKDAWSSDFTSMTASVDVWKQNVGTYFSQAGESMKDWADICAQTLEDSGLDDMDKTLGDIDQKSKDLKNTLIGEDGKSGVVAAMMAEVDAAGKLSEEYISIQDAIDGVIAEYEELLKILNEDYQSPNGPGDEEGQQNGNENDGEEENNDNNQNDDNNETPPPTAELSVGSTVKVKTSASKWASGEGIWGPVKGNNFKVMQISGEKVLIGDPCGPNYTASGVTGWIKKTDLESFDTGGYTGDWSGAYGKLALLHKKELILKEGDTANFLAGMDLLNKIISVIDLQSVNNSLGGLLSSPSLGHVGDEGGILEQQVHIEASFPGVSDHSEIEEAFNNLVNQAAQYANRK